MPHVGYFCAAIAVSSLLLLTVRAARLPHVLVAEDDPVGQRVATLMLQSAGCVVDLVPNGLTALDRLRHTRYDIVFLDCRMPLVDGLAVARTLRAQEAERNEPRRVLIAITADAGAADRAACLDAGMDDVVTKPLLTAEIQRVMRRWGAVAG